MYIFRFSYKLLQYRTAIKKIDFMTVKFKKLFLKKLRFIRILLTSFFKLLHRSINFRQGDIKQYPDALLV